MDRNYYYRVLGVRSDATPAQIKAAYNARMARLSSADYDDEPEYARRKKEQATKAYRVLMGDVPATTKEQKENRFERFKDKVERKEGFDIDDEKPKFKLSLPKIDLSGRVVKTTADKAKFTVVGTAITFLIAVIGLCSAFSDLVMEEEYPADNYDQLYEYIYDAEENFAFYDYYEMLDTRVAADNQPEIDWDDGVGEYGEGMDQLAMDILWWVGIYEEQEEFFDYYTGIDNYYHDYDDYDCATVVINWIGAPDFEEIAGSTNLYNGETILTLTDYMEYLEEFTYERY